MRKRYAVMFVIMSLSLLPALLIDPGYSFAIDKVTPTPVYQVSDDGELDVDLALESVVEQIEAKEYDSAIDLVGKIIQADEGSWEAFYYRAFAYTRQEKWDAAIADYDAALELRPHDSRIWRLRGDLHVKNSDPAASQAGIRAEPVLQSSIGADLRQPGPLARARPKQGAARYVPEHR